MRLFYSSRRVQVDPGAVGTHYLGRIVPHSLVDAWRASSLLAPNTLEDSIRSLLQSQTAHVCCAFATQVGPGWLNPTEEAVWPLAETLAVAQLAFQGLQANPEQDQQAHDDGMNICILKCCRNDSVGGDEADCLASSLCLRALLGLLALAILQCCV